MRKEVFMLVLVLSLGFVSAHEVFLNGDCGGDLSYKEEREIDNSNRYSVETYKYGYTYRTTEDFERKWGDEKFEYKKKGKRENFQFSRWEGVGGRWEDKNGKYYGWNKDYYYKWSRQTDSYEKIECYHSAPTGKFLYRKCI